MGLHGKGCTPSTHCMLLFRDWIGQLYWFDFVLWHVETCLLLSVQEWHDENNECITSNKVTRQSSAWVYFHFCLLVIHCFVLHLLLIHMQISKLSVAGNPTFNWGAQANANRSNQLRSSNQLRKVFLTRAFQITLRDAKFKPKFSVSSVL